MRSSSNIFFFAAVTGLLLGCGTLTGVMQTPEPEGVLGSPRYPWVLDRRFCGAHDFESSVIYFS